MFDRLCSILGREETLKRVSQRIVMGMTRKDACSTLFKELTNIPAGKAMLDADDFEQGKTYRDREIE